MFTYRIIKNGARLVSVANPGIPKMFCRRNIAYIAVSHEAVSLRTPNISEKCFTAFLRISRGVDVYETEIRDKKMHNNWHLAVAIEWKLRGLE